MNKYKIKEVTHKEKVVIGTICDECEKEILNEQDFQDRLRKRMSHYFEVSTHHNDWGNDSIDSYEDYDICSEKCLLEFLRKYFDGKDCSYCCDIKQVRI